MVVLLQKYDEKLSLINAVDKMIDNKPHPDTDESIFYTDISD